jgi:mono/diheme cytochrome c family protein
MIVHVRPLWLRGHLMRLSLLLILSALIPAFSALADTPPDFAHDIKPLLEQHCFKCHGPEKQKSGLRLDLKANAFKGGESGDPVIVPGSSLKSHLIQRILSTDPDEVMPPKGERLKPQEVAVLQRWIDTGAHWVETTKPLAITPVAPDRLITDQDRQFWSFVPPRQSEPGPLKNAAWPHNRIDSFLLSKMEARGLSPAGEAPATVLVRRLSYDLTGLPPTPEEAQAFLSDPSPDAYQHLVDRLLASPRFGEHLASLWLPLARYAEDQAHQVGADTKYFYPNAWRYREWVVNAFNRDLPYDQFLKFQLAADKFPEASRDDQAALGFLGLGPKYYNRDRLEVKADEWEDRVDTVSRTMLGLTVACARCHDHKFDPIPQRDYYALAGVFASTKMVNKLPDGSIQKGDLVAEKVDLGTIHAVEDAQPQDLNVFIRGNVERKGPIVPRHFLSILSSGTPTPFKEGSGRKELALAIAGRNNPLAARVIVNRIWGMLFGTPIVVTPSNFGHSGQPPTHPELLDNLAVRFMDNGWSIKWLVREIVTSSAYRQSSRGNAIATAADPSNILLAHMNRRRVTIEQWRDTILFVSGKLKGGGGKSMELDDPSNLRRTLYARISRLKLNDLLMQFDYPDANVHAEKRSVTDTAMQKLFMLNSLFMIGQAKALAARLAGEATDDEARVRLAYQVLFARQVQADELKLALAFLRQTDTGKMPVLQMTRWEQFAQILLISNEALYVD